MTTKRLFFLLLMTCSSLTFANSYLKDSIKACTADVNQWGNPSGCECSDSSSFYDQTKGQCFITTQPTACTDDINPWGFSSSCTCESGSDYDPTKGECFVLETGIIGLNNGNISCSNASGTTKIHLFRHEGGAIVGGQIMHRKVLTVKSQVVSEEILRQPGYYIENPDKDIVGWNHLVQVDILNSIQLVTAPGATSFYSAKMKVFLKGKVIANEYVICSDRNTAMYP